LHEPRPFICAYKGRLYNRGKEEYTEVEGRYIIKSIVSSLLTYDIIIRYNATYGGRLPPERGNAYDFFSDDHYHVHVRDVHSRAADIHRQKEIEPTAG
jgi:hypothetical protein